jgi:hypothetical protein
MMENLKPAKGAHGYEFRKGSKVAFPDVVRW